MGAEVILNSSQTRKGGVGRERGAGVHQADPLPAHALLERREREQVQEGLFLQVPRYVGCGCRLGLAGPAASASGCAPSARAWGAAHSPFRQRGDGERLLRFLSPSARSRHGKPASGFNLPLTGPCAQSPCAPVAAARSRREPVVCPREGCGRARLLRTVRPVRGGKGVCKRILARTLPSCPTHPQPVLTEGLDGGVVYDPLVTLAQPDALPVRLLSDASSQSPCPLLPCLRSTAEFPQLRHSQFGKPSVPGRFSPSTCFGV